MANESKARPITRLTTLKVNETINPIGIDRMPVFSWKPVSEECDRRQVAYRLRVASTKEVAERREGDLWDSGRVESAEFYSIRYDGKALGSHTIYYWFVESWDHENNCTVSELSSFTTGILSPDAWQGKWIGANGGNREAVYLRRSFKLKAAPEEAILSLAGLGYFELTVNQVKPDDSCLNCCNTQYTQTVLYRTYNLTKLLKSGENLLGVELGNGFYNEQSGVWNWERAEWRSRPKMRLHMTVRYADGTSELICSDECWQASTDGPITFNSIYYGEDYDARKEMPEWDKVGFDEDEARWNCAVPVEAPKGRLVCQIEDPVKRCEVFQAKTIRRLDDASYLVEAPEMIAGWANFTFRNLPSGDKITIIYSEKLKADDSVERLGGEDGVNGHWWRERNIMTDCYTAKGGKKESFEPKFSYKGFRYIQIYGYHGELSFDDVTLYRVRNDLAVTGSFECSNTLLNDLHAMMVRTVKNNLQGKPTDTPVWEKNGWLGDLNVALDSMAFNFDLSNFLPNFIEIMKDCYCEYSLLPQMVPTAGWGVANHYVWNSVLVFALLKLSDSYGLHGYLTECYPLLKSYTEGVISDIRANGWVCSDNQLGDWVSPMGDDPNERYSESPNEGSGIVGSAYVYGMLSAMERIARLTDHEGDIPVYDQAKAAIYQAFNQKFYNHGKGCYETTVWFNSGPNRTKFRQTSQLVPLAFGLVPEKQVQPVVDALVKDIEEKNRHLDTGCVGAKEILPILCDHAHAELAYRIVTQTTYPSWGYMLEQGSTSLWEMWENTARSLDHYFLGTYEEWFYEYLAGIKAVRNGYEYFTIDPFVPQALDCVTCRVDTVRGMLESSWKKVDGKLVMTLVLPYGSTVKVCLPSMNATVNCSAIAESEYVKAIGENSIVLGSGRYIIEI